MNQKKAGIIILILSIAISIIMTSLIGQLNTQAEDLGCFGNKDCVKVENSLNIVHIAFGVIGFLFALGVYLLIFATGEERLFKKIEADHKEKNAGQKFMWLLKALDPFEKKVMTIVKEQPGITQNTLAIKADLSKAKVSMVLAILEKKELVKRMPKGKTFAVFSRI